MSLCPICKSPTNHAYRPFCSRRCADVDLSRWFNESYSVPALPAEGDEKIAFPPLDHRDGLE